MIAFGKRIELMTDSFLLDSVTGLEFRYQQPRCIQKVLTFDQPWECPGSLGNVVFEDDGQIKLYYRGFPGMDRSDIDDNQTTCLAVSEDGLHFSRVPVNEIDYDGIKENNIVRRDVYCHNFMIFKDSNPECKPDEKYKAMAGTVYQGGLHVFASPDGIHFHALSEEPVLTDGLFDSMNLAFYDNRLGLYRSFSRYFTGTWTFDGVTEPGLRAIQSSVSKDFLHWEKPIHHKYTWSDGEEPTEHLYTNATTPIPGAEHMLVSIPMRFTDERKCVSGHPESGISDAILMTSRDGVHWDRSVKDAWLSGGVEEDREWTQRNFITAGGIIERDDKFFFYVQKHYMWDDCGIWAYSVPKYRLMSLYADGEGGSFTTKSLHFESDTISLNYRTSAYGYVRVTVRDMDGNTIYASDEIYGNELSHTLTVKGLAGKDGTLFIELKEANLYAIGAEMA